MSQVLGVAKPSARRKTFYYCSIIKVFIIFFILVDLNYFNSIFYISENQQESRAYLD